MGGYTCLRLHFRQHCVRQTDLLALRLQVHNPRPTARAHRQYKRTDRKTDKRTVRHTHTHTRTHTHTQSTHTHMHKAHTHTHTHTHTQSTHTKHTHKHTHTHTHTQAHTASLAARPHRHSNTHKYQYYWLCCYCYGTTYMMHAQMVNMQLEPRFVTLLLAMTSCAGKPKLEAFSSKAKPSFESKR